MTEKDRYGKDWLTTQQLVEHWGKRGFVIHTGTLRHWRVQGKGPKFKKLAHSRHVIYHVDDIAAFEKESGIKEIMEKKKDTK
jgi:hypothetical protein